MMSDGFIDYLITHRVAGAIVFAVCAMVSLSLVARLWVVHRRDHWVAKLFWSIVLLVPLLGWFFFAAFYRAPEALSWTGSESHGSIGGDGHV